jgi:hypothetical protein
MVFNATFNNISIISWRSVLLVEETGVPGENHRPQKQQMRSSTHKFSKRPVSILIGATPQSKPHSKFMKDLEIVYTVIKT